jgi:hypothetical protein
MSALAFPVLFVIGGLYVRRHYGGVALAALAIVTAAVMTLIGAGSFLVLLHALGTNASNGANAAVIAMMAMMQLAAFGCAAIAIHLLRADEGPWLTVPGFLFGLLGWVGGGVLAFGVIAMVIVFGAAGMAR